MEHPIDFLKRCDAAYHNGEPLLVSDYEYDVLKTEARLEFPDDPYWTTVGAPPLGCEVDLVYVLGSLDKKRPDGSLNEWLTTNDIDIIVAGDKLDGCTIEVDYRDGKVHRAMTRGDGYIGRDITEKAKLFCPPCEVDGVVELKGEVLAVPSVAKSLKDKKGKNYKKSRTFVAGALNRDGVRNCEHLYVVFYHVLNQEFPTYTEHLSFIRQDCGLPVVQTKAFLASQYPNIEDELVGYYSERKEESVWDLDGLVIMDNSNGNNTDEYYPHNAVAFKVNEDATRTTVDRVMLEVKRSGKIQPVVYINPVEISGSLVSKATGFNMAFIRENKIGRGSQIGIVLSGEIIPFIEVIFTESQAVEIPEFCPDCGSELEESDTGVDLFCRNNECSGRMLYRLENFLLSNGVEEVTATTIKRLGIKSFEELLNLDEFDISGREGFGASRASTIINQIKRVYNTSPANLLKSFGITGLGKTMSAELMLHVDTFEDLFCWSEEDFMKIGGIGSVMANRIVEELPEYKALYDMLVGFGLSFKKSGDNLKGLKVVLTGKSELKRNDIIRLVEEQGGMVKGMSKSVDILATNSPDSQTGKMTKARSYGIKIISYDELYEMLGVTV